MAGMGLDKSLLLLIYLTMYCTAKPVENENLRNEINTTPCPEELADQKLQEAKNEINFEEQNSARFEQTTEEIGTTPPCPDEINASATNSAENTLNDLEETLLELSENEEVSDSSEENNEEVIKQEETTTICPEELAKIKLENTRKKEQDIKKSPETPSEIASNFLQDDKPSKVISANKLQNTLQIVTEMPSTSDKQDKTNQDSEDRFENTVKFNQSYKTETETGTSGDTTTIICPEELLQKQQADKQATGFKGNSETETGKSGDTTTICPEQLLQQQQADKQETELKGISETETGKSDDTTTICPEKLLQKQQADKQETEHKGISEIETGKSEDTTTICPEELLQKQQADEQATELEGKPPSKNNGLQNKAEIDKNEVQSLSEDNDSSSTTVCPEKATESQGGSENNEISVKTLLSVQKDSALFKLVKDKLQPANARSKRQTSSYSPYYINQPGYNSEGIALSSGDKSRQSNQNYNANKSVYSTKQNNQKSRVSSQQNYQRPVSSNNVRTYQQIQRQYQNAYPKSYQNYVKQAKGYQNPNPYARYTNNGNIKSYYKTKTSASRRQFQSAARPFTTTTRSTRTTLKKFRPSPIFA